MSIFANDDARELKGELTGGWYEYEGDYKGEVRICSLVGEERAEKS